MPMQLSMGAEFTTPTALSELVGIAMSQRTDPPSDVYQICVKSILDESWVRALHITPIATHRHYAGIPRTILTLHMIDQAELLGLLNRLHNMGLTILSVEIGPMAEASLPNAI